MKSRTLDESTSKYGRCRILDLQPFETPDSSSVFVVCSFGPIATFMEEGRTQHHGHVLWELNMARETTMLVKLSLINMLIYGVEPTGHALYSVLCSKANPIKKKEPHEDPK